MKKTIRPLVCMVLVAGLSGCNSHDQDRAKADAKEFGKKVDDAIKPDTQSAGDKIAKAGATVDHAALLAKVKTKLAADAGLSTLTKVDVSVSGNVVTLSGTVPTSDQKKAIESAASQVDGVTSVTDNLTVSPQ